MADFAALPPEINSARMYSGPGSAPMRAAAAAWSKLGKETRSAAASYASVLSGLTGEGWQGPASASMATAAARYLDWLESTAAQAEQVGSQATAAATAYESALAMTVPPATVAANRAQLASLVHTNYLGQNTSSIAATEAQYGDMWAQDAAAMYGYAGASRAAATLSPFSAPPSTVNGDGVAGQAAAVSQATSASTGAGTTSSVLSSLLGPGITTPGSDTATTGLAGLLNFLDGADGNPVGSILNSNWFGNLSNGFTTSGLTNPTQVIDSVTAFSYLYAATANGALTPNLSALGAGLSSATGVVGSAGLPGLGAAVSAGMGRAGSLGALSIPASWSAAAPVFNQAAVSLPGTSSLFPSLGATPLVPLDEPMAVPAMTMGGLGGLGGHDGDEAPIYGFRPIVMARPPFAG